MAKIYFIGKRNNNSDCYVFHCPGCNYSHIIEVPRWTWNGSLDSPTFNPSLLVNNNHPELRCHSFIRDGKIQFLGDCFHELAGKTVDIPEFDELK